ncbi:MAG: 3-deoxy-manno-octulosonate-8-phosphatase KdsC [Enterobacterales bacterium]|nr:3-deoxy-manno-octulosonate-8-phosphatase KdsC [Enterobacterales bacterium]
MNNYSQIIMQKAKNIKLLICDVDGVLSNGKVYYSNQGEELKSFNIKDGLGIKQLLKQGIELAIITGRQSEIVKKRASELGIQHIYQGKSDKQQAYNQLLEQLQIVPSQVAYVGDDLPDLPLMKQSGLSISVKDGYYLLLEQADWVTQAIGGNGAVREITDLILFAQDKLAAIHQSYKH